MFMNNTVFGRISKLFSELGIDVSVGSDGAGEARAYAAGFDLVNAAFAPFCYAAFSSSCITFSFNVFKSY